MSASTSFERVVLPAGFIDGLREVFGDRLHLGEAMRSQHGSSEAHFETVLPDAVIIALSTEEVVAAVKACGAADVPIIAYGAGTSVEGNTTPVRGGVTIDLSLMDQIVQVNAEDFDVTVQAGVRREQLNEHLRDVGLFFPIDPGANATIGGMAATRASGTNAVRYGTMREAVLSLRVVTPDGREIRTARRARKSAAGYDLTRLFVGSEGTLGIITEITLRLHGIPESILSAVCSFDTLTGAVDTVVQSIQLGVPLARVEILDDVQMRAVNAWSKLDYPEKTTLFFEFHGSERYVQEQVETVSALTSDNGGGEFRSSSLPEERARLWKARHEAYYAALGLRKGCVGWPTDVCVPIGWLADRSNRVRMMLVLAVLWILGAAASAFATSFEMLFAARMVSALGLTVVLPVAISIAADLSPPEKRGRSLLLLSMGKVVGLALAFALGGALFGVLSERTEPLFGLAAWRATQLIFAGISALLILPLLLVREPVRQEVAAAGAGFKASMQALWERRSLLAPLFVGQISVIMADASASIWATPVLMRTYGLQPAEFGGWIGLVLLGSGLVGTIAGGIAADAGLKRAGGRGLIMTAVVASAIGVPASLFAIVPGVPGFAILLTALLLAGTATGLITGTVIAVLVPNQFRALCLGSFVVVGAFIGFGVAPSLVTVISEAIGGPGALAPSLAAVSFVCSVMSLIAFFLAARAAPGRT